MRQAGCSGGIENQALYIGYNKRDTKYIAVTENHNKLWDTSNYIVIRTADVKYRSQQELLQDRAFMKEIGSRARFIPQQSHGLVIDEIPRSAMAKIVIDGKEWPL